MADDTPPPRTLADKIDHLFRTIHPRDRDEFGYDEVAAAIQDRGGLSVSANYLWLLRTGRRTNPTIKYVEALAKFFGVPPAYFFDDAEAAHIDSELELLTALRDTGVRELALRAATLTPEFLTTLSAMLDQVAEHQRPPGGEGARRPGPAGAPEGDEAPS